jgi:ketosteroid isomerase-like protein
MQKLRVMTVVPAAVLTFAGFHLSDVSARQSKTIIALERSALDRWGKGDPQGYLGLYAPDVTYFDPMQERRVDGAATMRKLYEPIAGKVKIDSYEMLEPRVQQRGDVALLTFNLVSHGRLPTGDTITVRWNSTEVYARSRGKWSIIHSHWSFVKPLTNVPPG